jgi:DNA-binding response OmpR family regulator
MSERPDLPGTDANAGDDRRPHILVINDTQEILDLFRDILEDEGYRVSLYSRTFNDLEEIKRQAPDLILLDFLIGGEDQGWQMLQKLKLDRETMTIPVIVCTAAVKLVRELEGHLRAKSVGVIMKPFDIDDLTNEVNRYLNQLGRDENTSTPAPASPQPDASPI